MLHKGAITRRGRMLRQVPCHWWLRHSVRDLQWEYVAQCRNCLLLRHLKRFSDMLDQTTQHQSRFIPHEVYEVL